MMRLPAYSRNVAHWLAATLVAALGTALQVWLRANSTTAGMVFLVLVVWFAARSGILLSVYVAVLCALSFDYFFLPPVHSLRIVGIQGWVAMVSFLASCAVVSQVAERARKQAIQAEERREEVERLYALSQEMMLHEDATGLVGDLPRLIERIFALEVVVLYVRDHDQFYSTTGDLPASIHASLRAMAQGQNPTLVAPGEFTAKALMLGLRPVGALGWRPARLSGVVATAVSAQAAIALTRATAVEASARMEAARAGERLRAALIDSLTHELRTPLTSIRAAATTLLEVTGLDEAGRLELATIVDEESSRLDRLIGEAVEMAEIDANVVEVRPVPQHPRALLEQAVEESRAALAGRRVVIAVEEPEDRDESSKPGTPSKTERPEDWEKANKPQRPNKLEKPAWFDPHLLGRVLRHLLENAARHTPAGGRILLGCRRRGGRLEFRVEDEGPGVDPADLPFIFEKFYRGRESAAKGKGTGMGLAITRAILAAHGGGIEVESAPQRGASFRFWVPLVDREPASTGDEKSTLK